MKNFLCIVMSLSFVGFNCLQASSREETSSPNFYSFAWQHYIASQTGRLKEFEEKEFFGLLNKRIDPLSRYSQEIKEENSTQEIKQGNPSKYKKDWLACKKDEDNLAMEYVLYAMTSEQKKLLIEASPEESRAWGFDTISQKIKSQKK